MKTSPVVAVIDDHYALLVGKVISLYAYEEWMLRDMVYRLLHIGPKQGRLSVRDCRAKDYPELISTLIDLANVAVKYDFDALTKLLDEAETNRNMLAHSVWLKGDHDAAPLHIQVTKGSWPKQPYKPKVSKRVNPEGREMTDEYSLYLYDVVETAVRATIPLWNAVCEMTERSEECSQQPPSLDPNPGRNQAER